jgi:SnoaL-like domain
MKKLLFYTAMLCFGSCTSEHNEKSVGEAMELYDHLIQKMDTDSIALLYTPDGDLGGIALGRDSIAKFLATFKNFKVLSQSSTSKTVVINHDTAVQTGSYLQTVITPSHDTVHVKGDYVTTWQWMNGWHIKRMRTTPAD